MKKITNLILAVIPLNIEINGIILEQYFEISNRINSKSWQNKNIITTINSVNIIGKMNIALPSLF